MKTYTPEQRKRHAWLVKFHNLRGWLNCSHKSLERLEAEYQATLPKVEAQS